MRTFTGGCHCAAVRFRVDLDDGQRFFDCNCSICTKKGFLHAIVPKEQFELLSGGEQLAEYRFNTMVARHTFCRTCGMHPFYTPRSHPESVDVNLRCLDDVDLSAFTVEPFDGRRWEDHIHQVR